MICNHCNKQEAERNGFCSNCFTDWSDAQSEFAEQRDLEIFCKENNCKVGDLI